MFPGEAGNVPPSHLFIPLTFRLDETIEAMSCGVLSEPARSPGAETTPNSGVLVNPRLLQPAPLVSGTSVVYSRVVANFGRVELENCQFQHICSTPKDHRMV